MRKKVVVIGGGLSGLATAEILSKKDFLDVFILEAAPFLGGLASNFEFNGKHIPRFYHHIIKSNKNTLRYLKRFGEPENLEWKKIKVSIGENKKRATINSVFELMNFKYLTLYEKMRFGLFGLYSLYLLNPDKIPEGLDAEEWLNKYVGKNVTDKIFYHLYSRNKFNIPLKQISAKQFANRLHEKEIQDDFTFPRGGYQVIIDGLRNEIEKNEGKIFLKTKISKINLKNKYLINNGKKIKYDILVSTIPFEIFLKLSEGIPEYYKEQLSKIKWCPAVGICFGTEEFLDEKVYWTNIFNERIHIIMQHSVICDNYDDKITWCLRYGGSEDDLELSDEEIEKVYLGVVKKYFPEMNVKWSKVSKTNFAEPIYDIEYHKNMPNYKTPIDGLYFSGIQLTYPKIRNMNVALGSGMKVADIILKDFLENP